MSHSSSGPLVSTPVVSDDYSELLISKLIAIKVGAASLIHSIIEAWLVPPKREFPCTDRLTVLCGLVTAGGR
jgi:hypothetical protein